MNNQFNNQGTNPQMNYQQPQQVNPQMGQPVNQFGGYTPPVQPSVTPPVVSEKKKQLHMISMIVGVVCAIVAIFSMNYILNCSVLDIPLIQLVAGDDYDEMKEQLEDMQDQTDDLSDEEIEEFEDEADISFEEAAAFVRTPSINGAIKFAEYDVMDIDDETVDVFNVVRTVVVLYGWFIAIMMLLGAFLKTRVFTVIGIVVSLPFYFFLAGFLLLLVQLAACVAHIVVLTNAKKA